MDVQLPVFVLAALVSGLFGAFAFSGFLRWGSKRMEEPIDMAEALGSLIIGKVEGARPVGWLVHLIAALVFSILYTLGFNLVGFPSLPLSIPLGVGFGFGHGLIVTYGLMFFVAESHPVERYRRATFVIGVLHLLAHMVFGLTVGFVSGLVVTLLAST